MAIQFLNSPLYGDNVKIEFGNSADLQIYHDGNNSKITEGGTGGLYIGSNLLGIESGDHSETMAKFTADGSVDLYHNNVKKFETTSTGVSVTGGIFLPNNNDIGWNGGYSAGKPTLAAVGTTMKMFPSGSISGEQFTLTPTVATFAGNVFIPDNKYATFGGANNAWELQIGVVGDNAFIEKTATTNGDLYIKNNGSSKGIIFQNGGATALTIDSSQNATFAGNIIFNGSSLISSNTADGSDNAQVVITGGGASGDSRGASVHMAGNEHANGGLLQLRAGSGATSEIRSYTNGSERMRITSTGNLAIGTTSATSKLTISDNSYQILLIDTSTSNRGEISVEDAAFGFYADRAASTADSSFFWSIDDVNKMEINLTGAGEGQLRLNDYGPGNITGTAEFILGVDSNGNVIETSAGGSGTVTGSGTATRVAFWSGTTALSSDANLYWDNTNDRLGIGTTSPVGKLHINSGTNRNLRITNGVQSTTGIDIQSINDAVTANMPLTLSGSLIALMEGNVGVGTTSPDYKLEVQGVISSADSGLQKVTFANVGNDLVLTANADATNVTANILFKSSGSGGSAVSEKMRIDRAGNVGIGTTDPTGKLEVQRSQVTTQFDRDCFLRLHPTATTDEGGLTNIFFGTSTTNNFGVAVGGRKGGAGDTSSTNNPEFSVRILNDSITGTEVLNINTAGNATFAGDITGVGAITTTLGSGGVSLSGYASPDLGFIGYNYINNNGTESVSQSARNSWRFKFGSGSDRSMYIGYRAPNAAATAFDERLTIDSSGNATFAATANANIVISRDNMYVDAGQFYIGADDGTTDNTFRQAVIDGVFKIESRESGTWTPRLTIDTSGNVGIGTATPSSLSSNTFNLSLNSTRNDLSSALFLQSNGSTKASLYWDTAGLNIQTSSGDTKFTAGGSERMRIESGGDVGIGTTSPDAKLDIEKPAAGTTFVPYLQLSQTATASDTKYGILFKNTQYGWDQGRISVERQSSASNFDLILSSSSAGSLVEGIRIDHSGKVGIGTSAPTTKLQVAGTISSSSTVENGTAQISILNANTATPAEQFYVGNNLGDVDFGNKRGALKFFTGTTEKMRITSAGNVGIGTTNPVHKLSVNGTFKYGSALEQAGAVSSGEPSNPPESAPDAYLDIKVNGTDYLIPLFEKGS